MRSARPDDIDFLKTLLYEAAYWRSEGERPPLDEALAMPELALYVEGFGREGDYGLIAEVDQEPIGAAWWRHMRAGEGGYGFVDEATPELSIAVMPGHRGEGGSVTMVVDLSA